MSTYTPKLKKGDFRHKCIEIPRLPRTGSVTVTGDEIDTSCTLPVLTAHSPTVREHSGRARRSGVVSDGSETLDALDTTLSNLRAHGGVEVSTLGRQLWLRHWLRERRQLSEVRRQLRRIGDRLRDRPDTFRWELNANTFGRDTDAGCLAHPRREGST